MNRLTRVATAAVMMMWFALTIGAPPARAAVTITVDPGLFTGVWSLNGISYTGSQTLSVDPRAAIPVSIAGAVFFISVDASGTVVSQNTAAATASGSTLTLNGVFITVDPGDYGHPDLGFKGTWSIPGLQSNTNDERLVSAVAGLMYSVRIGESKSVKQSAVEGGASYDSTGP